jgi:hypothetical protein
MFFKSKLTTKKNNSVIKRKKTTELPKNKSFGLFTKKNNTNNILDTALGFGIINKLTKAHLKYSKNSNIIKSKNIMLTYSLSLDKKNMNINSLFNNNKTIDIYASKKEIFELFNKVKDLAKENNIKKIYASTWIFINNKNLLEYSGFKERNIFFRNIYNKLGFKNLSKSKIERILEKKNCKKINDVDFKDGNLYFTDKNNNIKSIPLNTKNTLPRYVLEIK